MPNLASWSTICALVTRRAGKKLPVPMIREYLVIHLECCCSLLCSFGLKPKKALRELFVIELYPASCYVLHHTLGLRRFQKQARQLSHDF